MAFTFVYGFLTWLNFEDPIIGESGDLEFTKDVTAMTLLPFRR